MKTLYIVLICILFTGISYSKPVSANDSLKVNSQIICFFEVNVLPRVVNLNQVQQSIIYPKNAFSSRREGKVKIKVLVGAGGNVIGVKEYEGISAFENEVYAKVKKLIFTPAISNSNPVSYWVTVPFSFKIKN